MSTAVTVPIKFQVQGDADVQNKLRQLNTQMQQTGTTATRASGPLQQTGGRIQQVGTNAHQTTGKVQQLNNAQKQATTTTQNMGAAHMSLGSRISGAAGGMSLAAASAVSLWSAYDNVTDAATKVDIAEDKVEKTRTRLIGAQQRLTEMQRKGGYSAEELALQQRRVADASNNMEAANFRLENAQEDLNQTWVQSATSIIPSVFTAGSGLAMMFTSLKGSTAATGAAMTAMNSPARRLTGVFRLLSSPLGLIGIAIGAVVGAMWALRTNFMGVRDHARNFLQWVREATNSVPFLRDAINWLVEGYKWLEENLFGLLARIPVIGDFFGDLTDAQTGAANTTNLLGNAFETLKNVFKRAPQIIADAGRTIWNGLVDTATRLYEILTSAEFQNQLIGGITWLFNQVSGFLRPIGEALWSGLVDTASWIYTTLTDPEFQNQFVNGFWYWVDQIGSWIRTNLLPVGQAIWGKLVDTATWVYNTLTDPEFQNNFTKGFWYIIDKIGNWLSTNLGPVGSALWGALVSTATQIYTTLTDPEFWNQAIRGISWIIGQAGDWIRTNIGPVATALWGKLVETAVWIYNTLQNPEFQNQVIRGVSWVLSQAGTWIATNIGPVASALWGKLVETATYIYETLTNPEFQNQVIRGVSWILGQAGSWISANVGPVASALWGKLVETATWIYNTLQDPEFQNQVIRGVSFVLSAAGNWIASNAGVVAGAIWGKLVTTASHILTTLQNPEFQNQMIRGISYILGQAGNWISTNAGVIGQELWKGLQTVAKLLPGELGAAIGSTAGTLSAAIINGLAEATTDLPQRLTTFFTEQVPKAVSAVAAFFEGLFTDPKGAAEGITNGVAALPGKVTTAIQSVDFQGAFGKAFGEAFANQGGNEAYQRLVGNVNSLWNWIVKGITALPQKLAAGLIALAGEFAKAVGGGLKAAFENSVTAISDAILGERGLWGKIKGFVTQIPGKIGELLGNSVLGSVLSGQTLPTGGTQGPGQLTQVSNRGGGPQLSGDDTAGFNARRNQQGGGSGLTPDFSAMLQAWTTFRDNVYIVLTTMTTDLSATLAGMMVLWSGHATGVGGQINAIGMHFQRLVQGLALVSQGVATALGGIMVIWGGHAAGVGSQVDATGLHFQRLVQGYNLLSQGVAQALGGIMVIWSGHARGVGSMVNSTGQHLGRLVQGYGLLLQGVARALNTASNLWKQHAGAVNSSVNQAGQALGRLVQGHALFLRGVQQATNTATNAWRTHANAVNSAVSTASGAVSRLASSMSSNMSRAASSMNNATSAANRLRNAINSLRGRTITITTRYRTIGSPAVRAARGFSGVVDQPTRIFAGEGNKPELVTVTPLSQSGGIASMNREAASGGRISNIFQQPTVRAGGSTGMPNSSGGGSTKGGATGKFKKIFEDTIADWVDNFGYELNKFRALAGGGINFEIAGGKHYKRIHEDRAGDFAKKYGYSLASYGVRNTKNNHYLTMLMNPGAGGGTPIRRSRFDPLLTSHGGIKGRGGKSLFDLGIASGPVVPIGATVGPPDRMGGVKRAATGLKGIVNKPTMILAGEGNRRESVNIQPLNVGNSSGAKGGSGSGGRPIVIELHVHGDLNGKPVLEMVEKQLLRGIYAVQ